MTLEEKKIIYSDLCCRLPYNVKIKRTWIAPVTNSPEDVITRFNSNDVEILSSSIQLDGDDGYIICDDGSYRKVRKYSCKPYLRSMSNMTSLERYELRELFNFEYDFNDDSVELLDIETHKLSYIEIERILNYLRSHHFDYNELINKGLAIEAPNNMYTELKYDIR